VFGIKTHQARSQFVKAANALPDITLSGKGDTDNFQLTMKRNNRLQNAEAKIYAPRFPKPQTEGFFVLALTAGGVGAGILALKRANWSTIKSRSGGQSRVSDSSTVKLKIPPPANSGAASEVKIDILVLSDSYPGMEWRLHNVVVPVAAPPETPTPTVEVNVDEGLQKKREVEA